MTQLDLMELPTISATDKELRALGAAFYSRECAESLVNEFEPEDFHDHLNRECFNAIARIVTGQSDAPLDIAGVGSMVSQDGMLRVLHIVDGHMGPSTPETVRWAAKYLWEARDKRWLREVGLEFLQAAVSGETQAADDISALSQKVLSREIRGRKSRAVTLQHILREIHTEMHSWTDDECGRIKSGFRDMDAWIGPVPNNWLVIICGRTSMGKTLFATCLAYNIAAQGKPILFVTLEMSEKEIGRGILAPIANVPGRVLQSGPKVEIDRHLQAIDDGINAIWGVPVTLLGAPAGIPDIRKAAQDLMATHKGALGGIVIDRVDYLEECRRAKPQDLRITLGTVSANLKSLASELECPVFLLCQLNRDCDRRGDHHPVLSDLRESGALEENAQRVIAVYRDDYYDEQSQDKGITELLVLKNKGPVGSVPVAFVPGPPRFADLDLDTMRAWRARRS